MRSIDQTVMIKEGRTSRLARMNQSSLRVNSGRNVYVLWKEVERKQTYRMIDIIFSTRMEKLECSIISQ